MKEPKFKTLNDLQQELLNLKSKTFTEFPAAITNPIARALNIAEEAGELAREERLSLDGMFFNEAKAIDGVGDILIATLGYCIARGWSAQLIAEGTLAKIKTRWKSGQLVGNPNDPEQPIPFKLEKRKVEIFCTNCEMTNVFEETVPPEAGPLKYCARCGTSITDPPEVGPLKYCAESDLYPGGPVEGGFKFVDGSKERETILTFTPKHEHETDDS